ncbi:hypothetical protein BH23DEI1_BH23DEI1_01190 [soil metagenome]|nr:hypothetical protein [Trueperaceae bacterium]
MAHEYVTLDGRPGLIRTAIDGSLLWESEIDGDAFAGLIRRAMMHGVLPFHGSEGPSTVRIQGAYYDAATGKLLVELVGVPTAVS